MAAREKKAKVGGGREDGGEEEGGERSARLVKNRLAADAKVGGGRKTKANFKLNVVNAPSAAVEAVRRRGRPSKMAKLAARSAAAAERRDAAARADPAAAKTRGGRRSDAPGGAEAALRRVGERKRPLPAGAVAKKKLLAKRAVASRPGRRPQAARAPAVKAEPPDGDSDATAAAPPPEADARPPDAVEVKREPRDSPTPESGSSSPRGAPRGRAGARRAETPSPAACAKSPYSTRSERSDSPRTDEPAKALRNGKRRSLKNALLTEAVELEIRKRKRLASDPAEDAVEEAAKRLRAGSGDGRETPKPSDATESDASVADGDPEPDRRRGSGPEAEADAPAPKREPAPEDPPDPASDSGPPERIAEKSLILDNMSKAFNDASLSDRAKTSSIRRSARQRKSTVKAKEHEETVLAERDSGDAEADRSDSPDVEEGESPAEAVGGLPSEAGVAGDASEETPVVPEAAAAEEADPAEEADAAGEADGAAAGEAGGAAVEEVAVDADGAASAEGAAVEADAAAEGDAVADEAAAGGDAPEGPAVGGEAGAVAEAASPEGPPGPEAAEPRGPAPAASAVAAVSPRDADDDDSLGESVRDRYGAKSFTHQDIDKLIDKLKNFEEQDRKRQEEISKLSERRATVDAVLAPKTSVERGPPEGDRSTAKEAPSEAEAARRDSARRSFEIELPSGVTLIKRPTGGARKPSTGPNARDGDSVTVIDKALGREVLLDVRKSIDRSAAETPRPPARVDAVPARRASEAAPSRRPSEAGRRERPAVSALVESPEKQREKEKVLKTLGLLTLKEYDSVKMEKQKQKELNGKNPTPSDAYTGTLKTVIKLNRTSPEKKRGRTPLKMTFQKSKGRGGKPSDPVGGESESDENPYYTIHKEFGGSSGSGAGSSDNHPTAGGQRKTHYSNRSNNHELGIQDPLRDAAVEANASTKETTTNLVIPEKASSFGIHPGRLCQDQCFYCGGKFGLYDTPCHIAQIKSLDRQKKILDNEEKLTVDSCLCDACYRHVDRRANCPSYRKRAGPVITSLSMTNSTIRDNCYANSCSRPAPHTLRRKWLVKMKRCISKVVQLDLDFPGLHTIPLCDVHYEAVIQLMVCALCKRSFSRNRMHYINQEYQALNPLLRQQGLPVVFEEKPVVCKMCRYYCTLLLRPTHPQQVNKHDFIKNHRRRLMQAYNVELPEESDTDNTDEHTVTIELNHNQNDTKEKKKGKNGKNKKSDEGKLLDENCISDGKNKTYGKGGNSDIHKNLNNHGQTIENAKIGMEEDIESLISSNKIPVPNSTIQSSGLSLDMNDSNCIVDYDMPSLDKQSELQSILQKCNVPSTTILQRIEMSDLTQKSRNILKVHNAPAINKGSHTQKKMNRNLRRIQKLGQIITHKEDFEETLSSKIPNREDFTIEPTNASSDDRNREISGSSLLRNIALNDECTIETIPTKNSKGTLDINSMRNKWQMTESFSQVKKNLNALSRNLTSEQLKKRSYNQQDSQFSNPVRRLETNPSISVRELFPGEEEMNLQCSIDFGNVKGVTPEGWEKCSSTIQYDNYTKNLWQELQKPYGNQSSFLRHLILLEKYFRNGDLVLSQNANCNAMTYSESVQNRLRSYDNLPSNNGDASTNYDLSSITTPKISNTVVNTVTLISSESIEPSKKHDSVDFRKPIISMGTGKSLLKSNQNIHVDVSKSGKIANKIDNFSTPVANQSKNSKNVQHVLNQLGEQNIAVPKLPRSAPVSLKQLEKLGNQLTSTQLPSNPRPPTPRPEITKNSHDYVKTTSLLSTSADAKMSTPKTDSVGSKPRVPSLPPELIAINPPAAARKNMENVLKNIQSVKGSSTPLNQSAQAPTPNFSSLSPVPTVSQTKSTKPSANATKDPVKKGTKSSTKQWRPTLIPITDESKFRKGRDVLHQTADGRRLPSLVQVMSGGKPYLITIEDYNRMCIMRREKLQAELHKNKTAAQTPANTNQADGSTDFSNATNAPSQNKPTSPVSTDADKSATSAQPSNGKPTEQSVLPVPIKSSLAKNDDNSDSVKAILPDLDATSLLKNVALKNITIAPITNTSDSKTSTTTNTSQSLLITNTKSAVQVPPIISQLNSSVSLTAETLITGDVSISAAAVSKAIPIASQAIIMSKFPKSLTVIPQTVTTSTSTGGSSPAPSTSPSLGSFSVLSLPATVTLATPTVTVSPSEP